jgi:hypothetical protein
MKKITLTTLLILVITYSHAQQCLTTGKCTTFGKEYPKNGAPYTAPFSWKVLIDPAKNAPALMNGGNYTRFNVVQGNTYEWSYCEEYGGTSTSWDAQLTLFDDANPTVPICFSTDVCGSGPKPLAPYISWKANFNGVVRILTTAFSGGAGCLFNSSTYNKLAYRQIGSSPKPDLTIGAGSQSATPKTISAGSNITAFASLHNSGSGNADPSVVGVWLSTDTVLYTSKDLYLGDISGYPSLSANANSTILSASLNIPSTTIAGKYYLFFWADGGNCRSSSTCATCSGSVNESNECNNFASAPITITPPRPSNDDCSNPMLLTSYTSPKKSPGTVDGATSSGFEIQECSGFPTKSPTALDVWFSFVAKAETETISIVPAGNSKAYIDAVIGLYSSCDNNGFLECFDQPGGAGVTTTHAFNGLTPGNLYYIRVFDYGSNPPVNGKFDISVTHEGSPDLIMLNADIPSPEITDINSAIATTFYVKNQGTVDAAASHVKIWLSTDALYDANDIDLGNDISVPALSAGQTSDIISTDITLPTDTKSGTWYIIFGADGLDEIAEGNNENNNYEAVQILVKPCTPPEAPVIQGASVICQGQYSYLTVQNPCNDCKYIWSDETEGTANNAHPISTTSYTVTVTNTCTGDIGIESNAFEVTVNPVPDKPGPITGQNIVSVNSGIPYQYFVDPVSNADSYIWRSVKNIASFSQNPTSEPQVFATWNLTGNEQSEDSICVLASSQGCESEENCTDKITLPLILKSFSVSKQAKGNLIEWVTLTEINTKGFEIERSSNGRSYEKIGFVSSKGGSSNSNHNYSFIDNSPANGINYYRLHIIDFDGKSAYSAIRALNNTIPFSANIVPNPVSSNKMNLVIRTIDAMYAEISIIDAGGKILLNKKLNIVAGYSSNEISLVGLANGVYYLKIISAGIQTSLKFIKK